MQKSDEQGWCERNVSWWIFSSAHKRLRGVACRPATPWQNQYQGSFRDHFEAEAEMYSRYEALSASGVFWLTISNFFFFFFLALHLAGNQSGTCIPSAQN